MFDTFGMPSASDARYGAPPEASRSPLRFSSSVRVTRSIAGFSAWLSSKIAPRTERSASRLFGSGFSRVVSTGMRGLFYIRLFFAFVPRSPQEGKRRFFNSGYGHFTIQNDAALCVEVLRASIGVPVHRLGNLCKTFRTQKSRGAARCAPFEKKL